MSTRLVTLFDPWSPTAENFRLIRTNLEYSKAAGATKVILLTSCEVGDGKTLTSLNLAIMMASAGRRTLLIDADLRRPMAHKLLGLPGEPGLAEFLEGRAESPGIASTVIEDLSFLSAGKSETSPAELLSSVEMRELLDRLRTSFDVVIVDSPPALAVTDPLLLAPYCDAALLVVSSGHTDLRALEMVRKTFSAVEVAIRGVILNRFDARKAGWYHYGYRDDTYYTKRGPRSNAKTFSRLFKKRAERQ